jgi:putative transferase (TIGR04331 family)
VKRFLITTALEETWSNDTPVVFMGEWCRLFSRKDKWERLKGTVLPYHWADRKKLYIDYQYLTALHEKLLEDLSLAMNKLHGVENSNRYWRIILGPWLGYFVQMVFDRWCMVKEALKSDDYLLTIVLRCDESVFIPNDMSHFDSLYVTDEWNHHIYSLILRRFSSIEIIDKQQSKTPIFGTEGDTMSSRKLLKRRIASIYSKIARIVNRDNTPLFINTYLTWKDQIRLSLRFLQLPVLPNIHKPFKIVPDFAKRKWNIYRKSKDDFENFIRSIIPTQIPVAYLEGFSSLNNRASEMDWPRNPNVIFTSNSYNSDDIFKVYAANHIEKSTALVIGQHGGHYGSGKWSFTEEHEIAISDKYFSWGWTDESRPKVKPVGQLKGKAPLGVKHEDQTEILLVTSTVPRFSYFMYSIFVSSQWLNYFDDQCSFVSNLSKEVRARLTVRLYKHDYGWNQMQRWEEKFPQLKYDNGLMNINDHIRKSRIFVSTYNATTYLESFTMNIPTIIYWNENHWELRNSAIPYFEDLKRVGIFHETPESAAKQINAIWHDVPGWWNSKEVNSAVEKFKAQFCNLSDNLVDNICDEVKRLITGKDLSDGQ